jgi:hypothetical protein
MQPALDYNDLTDSLRERFRHRYDGDPTARTRMVGVVFARPNSPLARDEIIPQINDWHFRSGDHIDFYFAGYTYPHPLVAGYQEVPIPGSDPWLYSSGRFNAFREDLESRTAWKYRGACELLLTNARYDSVADRARLDFSSTICCRLDEMLKSESIRSIETFFEVIFRFAESASDEDPTWGFSDARGLDVAGSALKRVVLSLLPKELGEDYKRAEQFVVQDVGR